jgi:Cu/Ag efflux protein CusF
MYYLEVTIMEYYFRPFGIGVGMTEEERKKYHAIAKEKWNIFSSAVVSTVNKATAVVKPVALEAARVTLYGTEAVLHYTAETIQKGATAVADAHDYVAGKEATVKFVDWAGKEVEQLYDQALAAVEYHRMHKHVS